MASVALKALDLKTLAAEVKKLAAPVDFAQLERDGLLKKVGAWYEVPNIQLLPDHVRLKISEIKVSSGKTKSGSKTMVKLKSASSFDRLAKEFKRLGLL